VRLRNGTEEFGYLQYGESRLGRITRIHNMTIHLSGATVGKSGSLQNSCQLEFDSLHRGVENFWKGSFAPIRKHIVGYDFGNLAVNPGDGEVYIEVTLHFGGVTQGKKWGDNGGEGYTYYLLYDSVPEQDLREILDDPQYVEFDSTLRIIGNYADGYVVLYPAKLIPSI